MDTYRWYNLLMVNFVPGRIVKNFTTKTGEHAVIRYPQWTDLDEMVHFINMLSLEDTFITFSGETITHDGEMYYLTEMIKSMEMKNAVYLACFIDAKLVGSCTIIRDLQSRKRSYHIGIFGITIIKEFREIGIGEILASTTITEATKQIPGLKILSLNVFGSNMRAQSLYKKLGFTQYALLPKGVFYKDEYIEEIKMFLSL